MKKATINISDVKYFADEHELHILAKSMWTMWYLILD